MIDWQVLLFLFYLIDSICVFYVFHDLVSYVPTIFSVLPMCDRIVKIPAFPISNIRVHLPMILIAFFVMYFWLSVFFILCHIQFFTNGSGFIFAK